MTPTPLPLARQQLEQARRAFQADPTPRLAAAIKQLTGYIYRNTPLETFNVEITDTFDGEANYCWVRRYTVKARSLRGAIQIISRKTGYTWRKDWDDGETVRYNAQGANVCCFISSEGN